MSRTGKRIIAMLLIAATLLTCAGCSVTISEEHYQRYKQDPEAYLREQLKDHPGWADFLTSSFGLMLFDALVEEVKTQQDAAQAESKAEETTPTQPPEEEIAPPKPNAYYVQTSVGTKFLKDFAWDYMNEKNTFFEITGFLAHGFVGAQGKYREAFRSYIKEFIVENETRYAMMDIPFEEEKESVLQYLSGVEGILEHAMTIFSGVKGTYDTAEQMLTDTRHLKDVLQEAVEFPKNFDENFAELVEKLIPFLKQHKIEKVIEIPALRHVGNILKKVDTGVKVVTLAIDVTKCVTTYKDIRDIQSKAYLFFELELIFMTIAEKAENYYMRKAAEDILKEIRTGYHTNVGELIRRKGAHAVIDAIPLVGPVSSVFDFILTYALSFDELKAGYAGDAVRHINMACCELLEDYTTRVDGEWYYYDPQDALEVQVYMQHCLQSNIVSVYSRSEGKILAAQAIT